MEYSFGIPLNGKVTVNADVTNKQKRYIQIRMEQLAEDMEKATMNMTRCGSTGCIQRTRVGSSNENKPTHNCYMQSNAATQDMTGTGQYVNVEGK